MAPLSRLRLPPGARMLPSAPLPPALTEAAGWYAAGTTSLDRYQLFALAQPAAVSTAFFAARVPAGLGGGGTGQGSGPGGAWFTEVSYLARSVPAGIFAAQLVLTVVPAGSGGSMLRADAQAYDVADRLRGLGPERRARAKNKKPKAAPRPPAGRTHD